MATRRVKIGPVGDLVRANLHSIRKRREMSLRQLAEQMAIVNRPLSHVALSEIERGSRRCDADDIAALAEALNVPIADLFGEPAVLIARQLAFRQLRKIVEEANQLDPEATRKVVNDGNA